MPRLEAGPPVDIAEEPIGRLAAVAAIPSAFRVERVLHAGADGTLREEAVAQPWVKDYDAIAGNGPPQWAQRFEVANWGLVTARAGGELAGAAVVAVDTPGLDMLAGRRDLAVLWDLRVRPDARRRGIGARLFAAAAACARDRGARELHAETQNVNVSACRFYQRMGCKLASVDPDAYPELPGEVQLIWAKAL